MVHLLIAGEEPVDIAVVPDAVAVEAGGDDDVSGERCWG
jgi:hypothetical protein